MLDRVAASNIVAGVLAALLNREKTGAGQEIELSLYHVGVWTVCNDIQGALVGLPLSKSDRTKAPNPIWNTYSTRDGRWFQ